MQTGSRKGLRRLGAALAALVACSASGAGCLVLSDVLLGTEYLISAEARHSPNQYLELARSRVSIGSSREQAVQLLSDAWYHAECEVGSARRMDLFLYGHQDSRATAISVRSTDEDGEFVVVSVGLIDSSTYVTYADCLPPGFVD